MTETLTLEFDGGSRGNPGPAAIGFVIRAGDGAPLAAQGRPIGRATNNVAEYRALIGALEKAKQLGARRVKIRGDSELVIKQLKGEYRVKNPDMRVLHDQATALIAEFNHVEIDHNLRHKNVLADKLVNRALDLKREVTDDDLAGAASPLEEPSARPTAPNDRFTCARCGCEIVVRTPSRIRPHQLKPFVCQCGRKMEMP